LLQADGIHQADPAVSEAVFFVGLIKGIRCIPGCGIFARTITEIQAEMNHG
jgi:hypothetical protein